MSKRLLHHLMDKYLEEFEGYADVHHVDVNVLTFLLWLEARV